MSVTIEQVPAWLILRGVGHALRYTDHGWHMTLCGTWTPCGERVLRGEVPARKCRACCRNLKTANLDTSESRP